MASGSQFSGLWIHMLTQPLPAITNADFQSALCHVCCLQLLCESFAMLPAFDSYLQHYIQQYQQPELVPLQPRASEKAAGSKGRDKKEEEVELLLSTAYYEQVRAAALQAWLGYCTCCLNRICQWVIASGSGPQDAATLLLSTPSSNNVLVQQGAAALPLSRDACSAHQVMQLPPTAKQSSMHPVTSGPFI
jgi:hypothetical protein